MIVTKIQKMDLSTLDGYMSDVGRTYTWRPAHVQYSIYETNKSPPESQQDEHQKDFYSVPIK